MVAVLAHQMPEGEECPVGFASRSLTLTERKYSQLDKEALAIIFAVKKYHQFSYGRQFALKMDHKPLVHIFSEKKATPVLASGRRHLPCGLTLILFSIVKGKIMSVRML